MTCSPTKLSEYTRKVISEIERDEKISDNWRLNEAAQEAQSKVKVIRSKPKGDDTDGSQ